MNDFHHLARTRCDINLAALCRNFARLVQRLPFGGKLLISAKKQAYGHGLPEVAAALQSEPRLGAIGLATIEEALALRQRFPQLPIVMFTVLQGENLEAAVAAGLTLTVTDLSEAQTAAAAVKKTGREARAHFKLDTGMGRLGRLADEVLPQLAGILSLQGLRIEAVYSHLADAWHTPASGRAQVGRLDKFLGAPAAAGLAGLPIHWGGSDVLALAGELPAGTSLRAGIALYGDHPAIPELEPAMTVRSRVVYQRSVPAGTTISYGMTHTTTRASELAIVGAGYGNGYPRCLGNRGQVLIGGVRRPILGRVCMDQFVADVTDGPPVQVGDDVVLFGRQEGELLPAAEVASWAGTISYELFCLAGGMNPRNYGDEMGSP